MPEDPDDGLVTPASPSVAVLRPEVVKAARLLADAREQQAELAKVIKEYRETIVKALGENEYGLTASGLRVLHTVEVVTRRVQSDQL